VARVKGIGRVGIRVRNLQRATDFYEKLLGLRRISQGEKLQAFDVGAGIRLCLSPGRPKKNVGFDFTADDVGALHRKLGEVGVHVSKLSKDRSTGLEGFFLIDPDGHKIQVWSSTP